MIIYPKVDKEEVFNGIDDFYDTFAKKFELSEKETADFYSEVTFLKHAFRKDTQKISNSAKILYLLEKLGGVYDFFMSGDGEITVKRIKGIGLRYCVDNGTTTKEFFLKDKELIEVSQ